MSKNKQPDLLRINGIGRYEDRSITFGIDPEYIMNDYDAYVKFVKGIEHAVRKDDRYNKYVAKIHEAGLDQCAILGKVDQGGDKIKLEMHHGPIFTLFDYADILLKYHLLKNDIEGGITTFDIADELLTCHEKDWIMVVMLSKTAHKAAHKNVFIDIKATVGHIENFIEKYNIGMEDEHWDHIERYIEKCKKYAEQTHDNGLFDTAEKLLSFSKK